MFLENIRNMVQCSVGSAFVFKPELVRLRELHRNLSAQKTVLDSKYVDMIGLAKLELQDPMFSRYLDAQTKKRTQDYMSYPVFSTDSELAFNF